MLFRYGGTLLTALNESVHNAAVTITQVIIVTAAPVAIAPNAAQNEVFIRSIVYYGWSSLATPDVPARVIVGGSVSVAIRYSLDDSDVTCESSTYDNPFIILVILAVSAVGNVRSLLLLHPLVPHRIHCHRDSIPRLVLGSEIKASYSS